MSSKESKDRTKVTRLGLGLSGRRYKLTITGSSGAKMLITLFSRMNLIESRPNLKLNLTCIRIIKLTGKYSPHQL